MNYLNYRISLDIHDNSAQASISLKHGDTGAKIIASLYEHGEPYIISDDSYAVFFAVKADEAKICNNCIIQDNTVVYDVTEQTVSADGRVDCEFVLYDSSARQITAPRFTLFVYKTLLEDIADDSQSEYNTLAGLISEANDMLEDFNTPSAEAVGLAAGEAPQVNVSRTDQDGLKFSFSIPKGDQGETGPAGSAYSIGLDENGILALNATATSSSSSQHINKINVGGTAKQINYQTLANLPAQNALTVKVNNTNLFTFNTTATKSLNIKAGDGIIVAGTASGDITITAKLPDLIFEADETTSPLQATQTLSYNFTPYKLIRMYYRMPANQGVFDMELEVEGANSLGVPAPGETAIVYDPYSATAVGQTLDSELYLSVIKVSINQAKNLLTVKRTGFLNVGVSPAVWNVRNNENYYIYRIEGYK